MSISKIVAAIAILVTGLAGLPTEAVAAVGRVNIQTSPAGVRYLIVTEKEMIVVHEGTTPRLITEFPTGRYRFCYELEGYETVWEDASVTTYESTWVGPPMRPATGAAQTGCHDQLTKMKVEKGLIRGAVLDRAKELEPGALQQAAPAVEPTGPAVIERYYEVDHDDDHHPDRAGDRQQRLEKVREKRQENLSPSPR